MAWLTGWSYRKKLTLASSKVDADCSDFPFKVILDGDNFDFSKALSTGNDLRFTASDGETLLKYERELHQISTTEWDGFQGTVTGSSSFDISNADYIAVTSSRCGLMHKYARLATSIDASGDFAFQFGLYLASYSFNMYGSITNIGLDASGDGYYTGEGYGNEEYLGIAVEYDTDRNAKPYVCGIFENSRDSTTGYALNSTTQYIIKLSKTGTTLKTAVCSSDGTELWSNTATASTTPTLSYYKVVNRYLIDASSSYWTYRLSDFYNGATEDTLSLRGAVYHVKVPTVSSTSDTDVYMYYGKADAADGADPTNVWDNNYAMVHHMGSSLLDSTSNGIDGTNSGTSSNVGALGYYRTFDGVDDSIGLDATSSLDFTSGNFTVESLVNDIYAGNDTIFSNRYVYTGGKDYGYALKTDRFILGDGADYGNRLAITVPDATLHTVSGVRDGTSQEIFMDGSSGGSMTAITVAYNASYTKRELGGRREGGDNLVDLFDGDLYEFRISNIARSDAWIKATYHSLADTLLTYGSEEALRPRVMVVWA